MDEQPCPICGNPLSLNPRYPRAVCVECMNRVEDTTGRRVQFFNADLSGGLVGRYMDDGSPYDFMDCVIDGHTCQASEAHMGGVVVEVVRDK